MRSIKLIISLVLGLAAIASPPVVAQERLNFAYISPNAGSSSVLWVAKDTGIFKKHGLDVNVIYIEGTPKALMSTFEMVGASTSAGRASALSEPGASPRRR